MKSRAGWAYLGLALITLTLLVNAVVHYTNITELDISERWVTRSHETLQTVSRLFSAAQEIEANERGYLITGDASFLKPHAAAVYQLNSQLESLLLLAGSDANERAHISELNRLLRAKLAESAALIAQRQSAAAGVSRPEQVGQPQLMSSIAAEVEAITAVERNLLGQRSSEAVKRYNDARWQGLVAMACGLIIVLFTTLGLRRHLSVLSRSKSLLADSEARFQQLAENIDSVFWITEFPSRDLAYVSPSLQRVFGIAPQALYDDSKLWQRLVHAEDLQRVEQAFLNIATTGKFDVEYRVNLPNGQTRWLHDRGQAVLDAQGKLVRVVGIADDITETKRAAQALTRAEGKLQRLVDSNIVGVRIARHTGEILEANDEFLRIISASRDDLNAGKLSWRQITPAESRDVSNQSIARMLETGHSGAFEKQYRRPDGTLVPVLAGWASLDDGETSIGFVLDISARKQDEAALRASEAAARQHANEIEAIYATAPVGMCILDRQLRYRRINERLAEMNGMPVAAHIGRTVRELLGTELADYAEPLFQRTLQTGHPLINVEMTGETTALPGIQRGWLVSCYPIKDEQGQVIAINVVADEITARKRAEQALRDSEDRARARAEEIETIMMSVPAALWIAEDPACERVIGNAEAAALLRMPGNNNFSPSSSSYEDRRTFSEYRDGKPIPIDELPLQVAAARGVAVRGSELTLVFDDGEVRNLFGNAAPLRHGDGTVRGAVAAFIDVTQQTKIATALRDADQRKDEFLAMLAHELRNPLAPISMAAHVMRKSNATPEQIAQARDMISRQVDHLTRLVNDLLDVSRISQGKITLQREPIDLRTVVNAAIEAARPLNESAHHQLTVDMPSTPIWVDGDAIRLTQVVTNLLTNSAKYTPQGGRIMVDVDSSDGKAVIEVIDNGIGISSDLLPRVFDLFTQGDRSLDRSQGGLGIGLSLVKRLVELHGGSVRASSDGVQAGSVFSVSLPVITNHDPAQNNSMPTSAAQTAAKRILIVEDNRDAAHSLAALLRYEGHETSIAYNGGSAIALAMEFKPQVVMLDIGLPGINGFAIAEYIRRQSALASVQLIALTGYGREEDRSQSKRSGFDHYLVKPVDPVKLIELINSGVEGQVSELVS